MKTTKKKRLEKKIYIYFFPTSRIELGFILMTLFGINIPFLVIRLLVKHQEGEGGLSVMTVKNAILITASARELYHVYVEFVKEESVDVATDGGNNNNNNSNNARVNEAYSEL